MLMVGCHGFGRIRSDNIYLYNLVEYLNCILMGILTKQRMLLIKETIIVREKKNIVKKLPLIRFETQLK